MILLEQILVIAMHSSGTGPASRQLQVKVGGVTPADFFS